MATAWTKGRVVFTKELRDSLRDRRSLASALVFALFGPLVVGWALVSLAKLADDRAMELPVAGADRAPSLAHWLEQHGARVVAAPEDPEAAVHSGALDVVLTIPQSYPEEFTTSRTATVQLLHDASRGESAPAVQRVRRLLAAYGHETAGLRLLARGLAPELLTPVAIDEIDLSTATARAARLLLMLPIFLLMATFVGGMNVAIDVTAGERERLSLESLLVHPVPRLALAAGKWGAAAALNLLVVALTLAVSVAVLDSAKLQSLELGIGLGASEALAALAVLLPLVALGPAVQMLIATFSRSFKEAQTYLSLLLLVPALPGFLIAFQTLEPAPWMDAVPLLGHQTLITAALRGETPGAAPQVALAAATLALTALAVAATGRLMQHERIVLTC